jgi:hypothetical protein
MGTTITIAPQWKIQALDFAQIEAERQKWIATQAIAAYLLEQKYELMQKQAEDWKLIDGVLVRQVGKIGCLLMDGTVGATIVIPKAIQFGFVGAITVNFESEDEASLWGFIPTPVEQKKNTATIIELEEMHEILP